MGPDRVREDDPAILVDADGRPTTGDNPLGAAAPAGAVTLNSLYASVLAPHSTVQPTSGMSYYYDGVGRVAYTVDVAGSVTRTNYDVDSRVTQVISYATSVGTNYPGTSPAWSSCGSGRARQRASCS